jgi:methionyl-tRNA formyltransferase
MVGRAAKRAAIAFAGTPQFAVPALRAVLDAGYVVPLVLTQPDRRAGRGRRVTVGPVKELALERGLVVRQPAKLRPDETPPGADWGPAPDLLVVAAYGLLLPPALLDWPRVAAINIHASLLPRWRGAAPIQHAILAGDSTTGVSIMRMAVGLDEGPVYARAVTEIGAEETSAELHDRLASLGAELLVDTLPGILDRTLAASAQDPRAVTYAPKITKRQARLDWRRSAVELARQVRAYDPWPVAEARLDDGQVLRIWRAQALDRPAGGPPGTIVAAELAGIEVATGAGRLRLEMLQPPGSRAMSAQAYLNAHRLSGMRFALDTSDAR